jgi:hypothetical protein
MKENSLSKGVLSAGSVGAGSVTRETVQARARELALIAGRVPPRVTQADYEQAKRELTGESDFDRQEAVLDAKRWDPVARSSGNQAPESPGEDEDEEGCSETEQLVDVGMIEAGRDQMLQAARAAENLNRESPQRKL